MYIVLHILSNQRKPPLVNISSKVIMNQRTQDWASSPFYKDAKDYVGRNDFKGEKQLKAQTVRTLLESVLKVLLPFWQPSFKSQSDAQPLPCSVDLQQWRLAIPPIVSLLKYNTFSSFFEGKTNHHRLLHLLLLHNQH